MDIIIKRGSPSGSGRSDHEERMRKEGWGHTMTDEENDKCKYLERVAKEQTGADKSMFKKYHIEKVD